MRPSPPGAAPRPAGPEPGRRAAPAGTSRGSAGYRPSPEECHPRSGKRRCARSSERRRPLSLPCRPMMASQLLLLLMVMMLMSLSPGLAQTGPCLSPSPIVINPSEVVIEDKSPLHLSCTIQPQYRDQYQAGDLYFEKNDVIFDANHPYFNVTSDYQVTLNVPQAQYELFRGHIRCQMKDLVQCSFSYMKETTADIIFRRDPLMPSFKSCIVQNWERLRCTWLPTREEQINYTLTTRTYHNFTYDLVYSEVSNNHIGPQDKCHCGYDTPFCNKEHLLNETCILHLDGDFNTFVMGSVYSLNIHARTDRSDQEVGSWMQQFGTYFNTSEHVKPNPVENLTFDYATGMLSWRRPSSVWSGAKRWSLTYNITFKSVWNTTATTLLTTENQINLSIPFTEYHVNVSVKPSVGGYWSDFSSVSYTTEPRVPVVNPVTSVVGYEYLPTCSYRCKALIRWQPIKSYEQYGPNLQYVVLRKNTANRRRRQIERDPKDNRITKTDAEKTANHWVIVKLVSGYKESFTELDITEDMEVAVITRNAEGQNSIMGESIFIMEKEHVLPLPEVLVIESFVDKPTQAMVSFEETPLDTSHTSYVLFWEETTNETPISWTHLPVENGTLTWNITLEKNCKAYRYGLGKIQNHVNSGIHWSTKPVYSYAGLADPPSDIGITDLEAHSVTLHWNIPPVQPGDGHIMYYKIAFCSWNNATHQCSEDHIKSRQVPGTQSSVAIGKLSHSTLYLINISSVTRSGQSHYPHSVYITTNLGLTAGHISGITVAAVVMAVFLAYGAYAWWKKCKKARKWYNSGVNVEVPEETKEWDRTTELGADSVSSETPFLPTIYQQDGDPYNRSISINSMDSGLSLDEGMCHEEMCGYVRTGYISSPTPLRSIPEDADIDDVFTTGMDPSSSDNFVETYKVQPGVHCNVENLHPSTNMGSSLPQGQDASRSAISKYAAITVDGQNDMEPADKYDPVMFLPGLDKVRIGSDERTLSPDRVCSYTQIQNETKMTKRPQNPFCKAFWNANRGKPNSGTHVTAFDHGKPRKIPRYLKHRGLDGSFRRKASAGYVANDGTFDPSDIAKVPSGYVANDGTFDPSNASNVATNHLRDNGPSGPLSVSKLSNDYVANDGTFDPSAASKVPNGYVPNNGTFDPSSASKVPNGYVPNDGTFDPSSASKVPSGYVPNDGTFDLNAVTKMPNGYVPNDGTFSPSAATKVPDGYVANDGTFDPSTFSEPTTGYVANDGSFNPSARQSVTTGYVANDGTFDPSAVSKVPNDQTKLDSASLSGFSPEVNTRGIADHPENCGSGRGETVGGAASRDESLPYSANDGTLKPSEEPASQDSSARKPDELLCNTSTAAVLSVDSGYVPHHAAFLLGSVDSLNHRLSAVGTDQVDDDCFDLVEDHGKNADIASHSAQHLGKTSDAHNEQKRGARFPNSGGSAEGVKGCVDELRLSNPISGCEVQTADKGFVPDVHDCSDVDSRSDTKLRMRPGRSGQVPLSTLEPAAQCHTAALHEHRKSAPGYINIELDTCDTINRDIPTTLTSITGQCGSFIKQTNPTLEPVNAPIKEESPDDILSLDDGQYSEGSDHQAQEQLADDDEAMCEHAELGRLSPDRDSIKLPGITPEAAMVNGVCEEGPLLEALSHNGNIVRKDLESPSKQNGLLPCLANGYVMQSAALDNMNGLPSTVQCGSPRGNALHHVGNGERTPRSENNNIMKSDFCRPSAIAKGSGLQSSAEAGGYMEAPLV